MESTLFQDTTFANQKGTPARYLPASPSSSPDYSPKLQHNLRAKNYVNLYYTFQKHKSSLKAGKEY